MFVYLLIEALLGVLLLGAAVLGRRNLLWMSAFLIPLHGMSFYVGVSLTWGRVIHVLLLLDLLVRGGVGRVVHLPGRRALLALLAYLVLISAGVAVFDSEANYWRSIARWVGWGPGQTDYRYVVQGGAFLQTWTMSLLGFCLVRSRAAFMSLSSGFVWGAVFSVLVGIYQSLARPLGLPWFDLSMRETLQGKLGVRDNVQQIALGPITIDRLYGLGGEPKHTAAVILVAICVVLAALVRGERSRGKTWILVLFALGVVLTVSTSSWVALLAFSGVFVVVTRRQSAVVGRFVFSVVAVLGFAFVLMGASNFKEVYESRFYDRVYGGDKTALEQEYKDAALLEHLQEQPLRAVVGHGAGGVDFFLIPYVDDRFLKENSTITPTYVVTRTLGDVGVIGLVLAGVIIGSWVKFAGQMGDKGCRVFLLLGAVLMLFVPYVTLFGYLFIAGGYLGWVQSCSARSGF